MFRTPRSNLLKFAFLLVLTTSGSSILSERANACDPNDPNCRPYSWSYWADAQGAYDKQTNRRIRFINVEYNGPADQRLWRRCFEDAVALYKRKDITFSLGGDNDFFEVGGLSQSVKRIVGWSDDNSGEYGYVVITSIEGGNVNYVGNDGRGWVIGDNPGNFETWKIGFENGDWGPGVTYLAAVQLWKHRGADGPTAGVAFWFRQSGRI